MRKCLGIKLLGLLIFTFYFYSPVFGVTYYVSTTGSDSNPGTNLNQPFRHIIRACTLMVAGDSCLVRSGIYRGENGTDVFCHDGGRDCGIVFYNSGTAEAPIVLKGYPGDNLPVVLGDSTGFPIAFTEDYITVDSIEFKGSHRGIHVQADYITIKNCVVDSTYGPESNNNTGAVETLWSSGTPRNLVVDGNTFFNIYDQVNGSNCSGVHLYEAVQCSIRNNIIFDTKAGIYLKGDLTGQDGCDSVYIHNNIIYDVGNGIHVLGSTQMNYNYVYNNIIYDSDVGFLHCSGYGGDAYAHSTFFFNNTVDGGGNGAGVKERYGFQSDSFQIFNNIFYNCDDNSSYGDDIGFKCEGGSPTNLYSDYNLFYDSWDPDPSVAKWCETYVWNLQQWTTNSGHDANSIVANPLFVNPSARNYNLQEGSPAATGGRGGNWPGYMGALAACENDYSGPGLSGIIATNISSVMAIIRWTTDEPATSSVEYGPDIGYGDTSAYNSNLITDHSVMLTGLEAETEYHYRVISSDCSGNRSISADFTFTTTPDGPPVLYNINAVPSVYSATVSWNTDEPATSMVEYGLTSNYGLETLPDPDLVTVHSVEIEELDPITVYHFRVVSTDDAGNTSFSDDGTFETLDSLTSELINLAYNVLPAVDGSYPGYNRATITDSTINPYGGTATTWASSESSLNPHWMILNFQRPVEVQEVIIYWAYNDHQSSWMSSQNFRIQIWNGSDYVDVANVNNSSGDSITSAQMPLTQTSRLRVYQPINMGPPTYPEILWLTEMEVYGYEVSTNIDEGDTVITDTDPLEIYSYPNPYRTSEGHNGITFTNLPEKSRILISTISGNTVYQKYDAGPDDWVWHVKNKKGGEISSGVYLYVVEYPGGSHSGKIMVIR